MLIVFTGNGKGKTTAALGQAMRVLGQGKSALMIQFIKGPWRSGEDHFAAQFSARCGSGAEAASRFQIRKMGLGFVGILGDKLPKERHAEAAKRALEFFKRELGQGSWDMIILDEINVAVSLGLVGPGEVLDSVGNLPFEKLLVFTGRGAPREFIERADLVTEMKEVKHPYADGRAAKIAVEF